VTSISGAYTPSDQHSGKNMTDHSNYEYAALNHQLQAIRAHFTPGMTEWVVNRPGEYWTEAGGSWQSFKDPTLTLAFLTSLAAAIANFSGQSLDERRPILSAALPSGERIQLVVAPAVPEGTISITLRKPSAVRFSLDDYEKSGFFGQVRTTGFALSDAETTLLRYMADQAWPDFWRLAVQSKQTILVSGGTGSGKTTFMKTLVDLVSPKERLITIEDTPELELVNQPNHVRLFYSKGGQGVAKVTARELLECTLRMKPDRIMQAEVRDSSAFQFVSGTNSGHPGSITSIHSNSEVHANSRLAMLMAGAEEAQGMTREDIKELIASTIDIVVQVGKSGDLRAATGIYYDPTRKLARLA
jgi:type IV secretion system protein VirB11